MTARTLTRAALALLLGAGLVGCSNVVDPTSGQFEAQKSPQPAATHKAESAPAEAGAAPAAAVTGAAPASSAEIDRLKRENQTLKVQQTEAQARIDALTKQMAQEREEQRKFREMMATNFDLLEQSVSKSLADNMERNRKPAADPKAANKTPMAGPAMTPPPAAAEGQPAPAEQGPTGLQPLPYWDDEKAGEGKKPSAAARFEPRKPEMARPEPARSLAANAPTTQAPSSGTKSADMPPLPGMGGAEKKSAAAASPKPAQVTSAAPAAPVAVALAAQEEKPAVFRDPDLEPPANPRALTAHAEAKPLYDKGFVYLAKGDFEESIRVYQDFLKQFPDDSHSDNAQFWIGEAHLQLKQTGKAEAAYREVLRNYAHQSTLEGYKTPDAIYRLGQLSLQRSEPSRAEYYFRNVTERFPDTTASQKAQRELESIRVNTAAGGGKLSPDS